MKNEGFAAKRVEEGPRDREEKYLRGHHTVDGGNFVPDPTKKTGRQCKSMSRSVMQSLSYDPQINQAHPSFMTKKSTKRITPL